MNRTSLLIACGLAVVVGAIFGVFPDLDLRIASYFFQAGKSDVTFGLRFHAVVLFLRDAAMWLIALLAAPAVMTLLAKLLRPQKKLLMSGRAIVFLLTTLVLAPGLLANVLLKDQWSRSRPVDVTQFQGKEHFVAWWDPRGDCDKNCSFVSGDVSGAFWTLAPAALAPPAWRALAYGVSLTFGVAVAVLRVMAGGHFFSDVFFAGFFTFLIVWFCYALIYRWPRTRLADARVDAVLTALSPMRLFSPPAAKGGRR